MTVGVVKNWDGQDFLIVKKETGVLPCVLLRIETGAIEINLNLDPEEAKALARLLEAVCV